MKKYIKIIINSVFIAGGIVIFTLLLLRISSVVTEIRRFPHDSGEKLITWIFSVLGCTPPLCLSYGLLWRSLYRLFASDRRRTCYTVTDIISVLVTLPTTAMLLYGILSYGRTLTELDLTKYPFLWLPMAVFVFRSIVFLACCFIDSHERPAVRTYEKGEK